MMDVKLGITGVEEVFLALRHEAERVSDTARKTMHRGADKIEELAKLNAPADEHNLEQSIRQEESRGYRGRLQIDIVMGGVVNGVNVDHYAVAVHENYDEANPGPGTAAKREANPGRHVGGKFLTRAAEEVEPRLEKDMVSAITRRIVL